MDIVQLELWPNHGAFAGGDVHTGTFTITGDDADPAKCGLCVRAVGHHGATDQELYFATAGTVNVHSFGDMPTAVLRRHHQRRLRAGRRDERARRQRLWLVARARGDFGPGRNNVGGTGGGGGGGGGGGAGGCVRTVGDL